MGTTSSYIWQILLIISIIAISYTGFCFYLHKNDKATFFYSYRDISIVIFTPIILLTLPFFIKDVEILRACFIWIPLISTLWLWVITYRSNSRKFFQSLFIFIGKLLLGIILWVILALSLGLATVAGSSKRKKYEWRSRHSARTQKAFMVTLLAGCGIAGSLLISCCENNDFSAPTKNKPS